MNFDKIIKNIFIFVINYLQTYTFINMKKIITFFVVMVMMISTGHSQFKNALKNIKEKAVEKTVEKTTTTSDKNDKSSIVTDKITDEPKYDPESPIYRAYSTVRDELKSTKGLLVDDTWNRNVEGRNEEAIRNITKIKTNLAKLQSDPIESKKPYVKKFEKDLEALETERKTKFDSYNADAEYDKKIEAYYKFAILGWEIQDKSLDPSYTGYYAMKKDFESNRPDKFKSEYVQKRVSAVDNFFKVEVYKVVPELDKDVDKIINSIHAKNSSGEESYLLNAKSYLKDFEEPIAQITYNKKFLLEDKTGIDAVQAKINKEKAILDEYVKSGKYDAHVAKYRQQIIDAVRMGASKMSNPKYVSMAIAGVTKGKASRAIITSDIWIVKKNEWGLPLYKYLPVNLAVTIDGKCWLAYGQIRKQYEGGGVYGGEYFDYWGAQDEMNCNNINK
jgi:hypothetical protein